MKKRGFTLFELLVSISIIAVLTALATISYSGAQLKARNTKRVQDMQSFQKAEELWYMTHNSLYNVAQLSAGLQWVDVNGNVVYVVPSDPKTGNYSINPTNGNVDYCACATLEGTTVGNSADANCTWNSAGNNYCVINQQ